jgi:hypothetical protein
MTSVLARVSGQRHTPAAICPGERTPSTHCRGGLVGLRAGLDTEARGKIPCFYLGSNLDRAAVQPVAPDTILTELPRRPFAYRSITTYTACMVQEIRNTCQF